MGKETSFDSGRGINLSERQKYFCNNNVLGTEGKKDPNKAQAYRMLLSHNEGGDTLEKVISCVELIATGTGQFKFNRAVVVGAINKVLGVSERRQTERR